MIKNAWISKSHKICFLQNVSKIFHLSHNFLMFPLEYFKSQEMAIPESRTFTSYMQIYKKFHQLYATDCLVVLPVNIIAQVLSYMEPQKCIGTLIVPSWSSAVSWPLLCQGYENNIQEYRCYKGNQCCIPGVPKKTCGV